ncbi:MAG: hypothetical protein LUQ49_00395 [Methanomicrobiales archaeon]|nr:hypothetical protein [Methanomicrobiales archaeon]
MLVAGLLVALFIVVSPSMAAKGTENGFDQFGYNYQARVFVGAADGVDRVLDGAVSGDSTYANDHLVMKWSKAWDDARFNGAPWTPEAWCDNEWNGQVPGGSGEGEHVKIQWIGACGADGTPLPDGGYCIWGQFEAIMDHYTGKDGVWFAHATPTGYGS